MKISVIIPTMCEAEMLDDELKQFRDEEVIVVADEKCRDAPVVDVCKKHGVKLLFTDGDLSCARNLGARAATGDWLLHTDDDLIYWSDTPCKDLEKWLKDNPNVAAAAGPVRHEQESLISLLREYVRVCVPIFFGHYHLIKKDVFEAVGGYRPRKDCVLGWEDVDMMQRLFLNGYIVQQTPFATIHRRPFNIRGFDGKVLFRV